MKYAVDRIEENIVILEEITSKEKKEIPLEELPQNIKEGTIIHYENNKYILDKKEETKRRSSIKAKFAMLRKKS